MTFFPSPCKPFRKTWNLSAIAWITWVSLLLLAGCSDPGAGGAGKKNARFGGFIFEYPSEEESLVQALGDRCREVERRVTQDLGMTSLGEIRVRITAHEQEFLGSWPGVNKPGRWVAAVADPGQGMILMKTPNLILGSWHSYVKIFLHEVAHIALHRALIRPGGSRTRTGQAEPGVPRDPEPSQPAIPRWLHEGYAQYLSREWSLTQEVVLSRAVVGKNLIPLGSLVSGFPEEESRSRLAYAESADLVHYLIRRFGNEDFHRFLTALGREKRFGSASRLAFGENLLTLEQDWKRHLRLRYTWFPLLGSAGTLWFLTTLVFLAAYLRKRISARRKLASWSLEDPPV